MLKFMYKLAGDEVRVRAGFYNDQRTPSQLRGQSRSRSSGQRLSSLDGKVRSLVCTRLSFGFSISFLLFDKAPLALVRITINNYIQKLINLFYLTYVCYGLNSLILINN